MTIIRLASRAAVLALCAAGTPALWAHEPIDPPTLTLEQARHDRAAVTADYALARALAGRLAERAPPLLADDLADAIVRGDEAIAAAKKAETVEDIEAAVWAAWAVLAHIVNAQPAPIGT